MFIFINGAHLKEGFHCIVGVAFLVSTLFYFVNGTNWLQFNINMLNVVGIIIMDCIEICDKNKPRKID